MSERGHGTQQCLVESDRVQQHLPQISPEDIACAVQPSKVHTGQGVVQTAHTLCTSRSVRNYHRALEVKPAGGLLLLSSANPRPEIRLRV